jgi:hypothetical protein
MRRTRTRIASTGCRPLGGRNGLFCGKIAPSMLFRKIIQARSSFFVLQALDLVTTLVAFHFGAFELNPLVGRLTTLLGPTGGVLASKAGVVLIALRMRKLIWVANLFYVGIVCWNTFILLILSHGAPQLAHWWM